ncbi:MAG TPA: phage holin family protein [Sphingobacteriaceae bacterium]|nr:phage holin family protein [Sphingobacteriaceae bacterium]
MLLRWLINTGIIMALPYILSGIRVENFMAALVAATVLGVVNAVIRPILIVLTLPINILTLGLFTFVINALMFMLAAQVVKGFHVDNFWSALLGSIILSVASTFLSSFIN